MAKPLPVAGDFQHYFQLSFQTEHMVYLIFSYSGRKRAPTYTWIIKNDSTVTNSPRKIFTPSLHVSLDDSTTTPS